MFISCDIDVEENPFLMLEFDFFDNHLKSSVKGDRYTFMLSFEKMPIGPQLVTSEPLSF